MTRRSLLLPILLAFALIGGVSHAALLVLTGGPSPVSGKTISTATLKAVFASTFSDGVTTYPRIYSYEFDATNSAWKDAGQADGAGAHLPGRNFDDVLRTSTDPPTVTFTETVTYSDATVQTQSFTRQPIGDSGVFVYGQSDPLTATLRALNLPSAYWRNIKASGATGTVAGDDTTVFSSVFSALSNGLIYIPPGHYPLTQDLTTGSSYGLRFDPGAILEPSSGKTLTLNVKGIEAEGTHQIFGGSGTVLFGSGFTQPTVYAKWFGCVGDGTTDDLGCLDRALAAIGSAKKTLEFTPTSAGYKFSASRTTPSNVWMKFDRGAEAGPAANTTLNIAGMYEHYGVGYVPAGNIVVSGTLFPGSGGSGGSSALDAVIAAGGVTSRSVTVGPLTAASVSAQTVTGAVTDSNINGALNVKSADFGAGGDGSADDTTAISDADASALAGAVNFFLPSGSYKITAPLSLSTTPEFRPGASLKPTSGVTVTLTRTPQAAYDQIFDLSSGGVIALPKGALVHPEWWGAKADGATDDAPAINAAYSALKAAGGGILAFQPGKTYLIEAPLAEAVNEQTQHGDNITWEGNGATIQNDSPASPAISQFETLSAYGSNIILRNLRFTLTHPPDWQVNGNNALGLHGVVNVLSVGRYRPTADGVTGDNILIDHCTIEGSWYSAIYANSASNLRIVNTTISNTMATAVFIVKQGQNITVKDCTITQSKDDGFFVSGATVGDFRSVSFVDNTVKYVNGRVGGGGVDGFVISGNHVGPSWDCGIDLYTGTGIGTNKNMTISSNVVTDGGRFMTTTGDTMSNSPTVANLSITKAWVVGDPIHGSGIPAGTTVTAVDATLNTLTLSANATATASGVTIYKDDLQPQKSVGSVVGDGIRAFNPGTSTVVIANNVVSKSYRAGILLLTGKEYLLTGNTIHTVTNGAGISIGTQDSSYETNKDSVTDFQVVGNRVYDTSVSNGISVFYSSGGVVNSNLIRAWGDVGGNVQEAVQFFHCQNVAAVGNTLLNDNGAEHYTDTTGSVQVSFVSNLQDVGGMTIQTAFTSPLSISSGGATLPTVNGLTTGLKIAVTSPQVPFALRHAAAESANPTLGWFETADGNLGFMGANSGALVIGGVSGKALKLRSNNADNLTLNSDGTATFAGALTTKGVTISRQLLAGSAGMALDFSAGGTIRITLGATNSIASFAGIQDGGIYRLILLQDGTGSRVIGSWPATVHFAGGTAPTLTTTANSRDIFTFYGSGTTDLYLTAATMDVR